MGNDTAEKGEEEFIRQGIDKPTEPDSASKRRMLIVDDNHTSRAILSKIFKDEYIIETAENGVEAMKLLHKFGTAVSVMLLDIVMPEMNGYEVLEKMQESMDLRSVPVIAVSADDKHDTLLRAIDGGATDYVTKPVDAELIRIRVRSAISKSENERLRAQNSYLQLRRDEELRYHTVLESTGTVVVEYDRYNDLFIYDDSIYEYIAGNPDNRSLWQVLSCDMSADDDDVEALRGMLAALISANAKNHVSRLVMLETPSKGRRWFKISIYKRNNEDRLAEKIIITLNDVHEEVLANDKLVFQAKHDALTGLYNRAGFIEKAAELVAAKEPGFYVMSCIDIEKFKVINDQYGTKKGDDVLCRFAHYLEKLHSGKNEICCRVMADNFAVLYPASLIDSPELLESHRTIALLDGSIPPLKFCIGRCIVDDKTLNISAIYDRAAIARETVKGRYDAYIATYDESMRTQLLRQQYIIGQMNDALREEQFEVWLQPQFNHATGMLSGAEALVRWRHPKDGIISPGVFIPIFEKNGFVYEVDKYVWEKTCVYLRKWLDEGLNPVPVSVNISRCDVFRSDLTKIICGLVKKYELPRELLRLEITESAFSESTDQIIRVVKKFVELGFVVEIDDFGSGYSSLNTLKDVPAQVLKMDMRFLENDNNAQRGGSIIESVVRMARWLGMSVIAEGVEVIEQADYLKSIGCEYIQGYLYAKPMPVADYEKLFKENKTESKLNALRAVETWNNNAFWNPKSMETLIFNSYVGGACIFEYRDGKTELLRYNDEYAKIFGSFLKKCSSADRKDIFASLDKENAAIIRQNIEKAIITKKETSCESIFVDDESDAKYVRVTIRQIAQAGDRSLFYAVVADITAQRRAERSEREIAGRISAIMDNINSGVAASVVKNGKINYLFANDRYYELLGYDKKSYGTKFNGAFFTIHPDDKDRVNKVIAKSTEDLQPYFVEFRVVRSDGSIRWMLCNITIVTLPDVDEPVHLATVNDTTSLHQAKQNERETAERISAVMDNATCGITAVVLHKDGTVDYLLVNDKYYELVGYTRQQYAAEGLSGLELMHPDDLKEYEKQIISLDTVGQSKMFEFRAKCRDGKWIWLRADITVITLKGVDSPVQLSCFTDISERKQADESLHFVNELGRQILSQSGCEAAIKETLTGILKYHAAQRSYIVELDFEKGISRNTYEVCAEGVESQKNNLQNIPFTKDDFWYTTLSQRNFFLVNNVNALQDTTLRELLLSQGIHSMFLAPLWKKGQLQGFAGVDNPANMPNNAEQFYAPIDFLNILLARRDMELKVEHYDSELLDSLPFGAALFEFDGEKITAIHINKRYWELVEREPGNYEGMRVMDRVFPADRAAIENELKAAIRQKRNVCVDARILCGNSEYKPFRINANIIPDADGKYRLAASYTLISEKIMSLQETLPIALSTMMSTSDDVSFIKDSDGRYLICSRSAINASKFLSESNIIGKTSTEVFGEKAVKQFVNEDRIVFETGKPLLDRMITLPARDGTPVLYSTSKYPLLDTMGKVIGIYTLCRDVTAEKATEFELNTLLRVIPSGVLKYSADEKTEFAYINDNFIESLGYTQEQFREKFHNSFHEMIWKEDRAKAEAEIFKQENSGKIGKLNYRIEDANGQLRWFHDEGVKVTDNNGMEWYYVTLVDVTAQRKVEADLRLAEEEYRIATMHSGHTIGRYDIKNQTLTITEDTAARLDLPECIPDVPYGRIKLGKISEDTAADYAEFYENIINGGKDGSVTFKKHLSNGWRWITEHSTTLFDDDGNPVSAIVSFSDVTEQQEKELAYKMWQQSIEGRSPETYTLFRSNLNKNESYDLWEGALLEKNDHSMNGTFNERTLAYAENHVYEEDRGRYVDFVNSDTMMAEYYRNHRSDSIEYRERESDGGVRWLRLTVNVVEAPNSKDIEAYLFYEDIDGKKRAELEAKHKAETDPLTGLLNRNAFAEKAAELIKKSGPDDRYAFFMLDIDGFKKLNDTFGHAAGDLALVETSQNLQSMLRKNDLLARLGGDEFVIFMSHISDAISIASKADPICRRLTKAYSDEVCLTVSLGIAIYPNDGMRIQTLYKKADTALYAAKESGRNTFRIYSEDLPEKGMGADF